MEVLALVDESRTAGGFYTPRFEVKIEGAGLPRDVLRDVIQLSYRDSVTELDSFELSVNNWEPTTRRFKYVGSEKAADLTEDPPRSADAQRFTLFEPCGKEVEVKLGYLGELTTMLTGTVTTMEPSFPGTGAPTLTVRGLNVLHQLRRKPYTWAWEDKKDSEIAENLATLRDEDTHNKRFPLPIETDANAKGKEPKLPYVAQQNQTDIDFLFSRARERGYVVVVLEADAKRRRPRRLYFGPSHGGKGIVLRDVIFQLEWQRALIDFKPTLSTAHQVRSVTVQGWNRNTKKKIEVKVDLDDAELNRNRDLYRLLERCDPREDVVVNEPVFTEAQAKQRARAILQERQKSMVQASATTIGLPDLRAGQLVEILGLGSRFSGIYFITDTTHTIGESGYTTQFNCRREDPGQGGGA
jgi:Bacteriophage probable baseplate hub protein